MKILLTGFEPFGDSPLNPSQMLVDTLAQTKAVDTHIFSAILPVDQEQGPVALLAAVNACQPDVVLCFGLAMGRAKISLERVALNLLDFRIPDNAGNQVSDQPIVPDGPAAYFSTLPIRDLTNAMLANGIPTEISLSAGSYLCNQVYYTLLHDITTQHKPIRAGFIHLPALPEQAAQAKQTIPSMAFTLIQKAAEILIEALARPQGIINGDLP